MSLSTQIQDMGKAVHIDGLKMEYGGNVFAGFEMPASEIYGLLAAMIILVLAFGSVLAMGLPIGTALIGLGVGSSLAIILSHVVPMPDFESISIEPCDCSIRLWTCANPSPVPWPTWRVVR